MTDELRVRLEAHCRAAFDDPGFVVTGIEPIPTGHSGFTYFVHTRRGGAAHRYVLRVPPPGARIAGPADVARQGRIMRALGAAGLPVPAVPILVDDPAVLDGRPFVLMDAVRGDQFDVAVREHGSDAIVGSTIEALTRLHAVPHDLTGLAEEAAMTLDGEIRRWSELMKRGVEELTAGAAELAAALAATAPAERPPALVHGDYHYGNLLFDGTRVAAILDWEIAQLGQPLLDLASLCVIAERRRFPEDPNPNGLVEVTSDRLMWLYGADPGEMRWYLALGCYKYASIFAYNLSLHRRGKRVDPHYERLTGTITGLLARGREALGA